MARHQLTVQEAAAVLGTTVDAVRTRVARGSIDSERGEDGRVYVWLDEGQPTCQSQRQAELVEELRDRIAYLEHQIEAERQAHSKARRLLAAALERMPPRLEAPESRKGAAQGAAGRGDYARTARCEASEGLRASLVVEEGVRWVISSSGPRRGPAPG